MMLQLILQKNKAATQHLLSISRTGPLCYGLFPANTSAIADTIQEIQAALDEGIIPLEEKATALEVIQGYQEMQKTFHHSLNKQL